MVTLTGRFVHRCQAPPPSTRMSARARNAGALLEAALSDRFSADPWRASVVPSTFDVVGM